MLISHYAAFVDVVVVIQPRLPAYGIRNNVLCYGVRACTHGGGGHEGYVHCTIQYDTNPHARVINNKLTTIFIRLIPANLAPCHLTHLGLTEPPASVPYHLLRAGGKIEIRITSTQYLNIKTIGDSLKGCVCT